MAKNKNCWYASVLLIVITFLSTCSPSAISDEKDQQSAQLVEEGLRLAKIHCSTCHAFPKAELLPQQAWGKVLPIMGFFLGAGKEKFQFADYQNQVAKARLSASGLFPDTPLISTEKWIAINTYYLKRSSSKQLFVEDTPTFSRLTQFKVEPLPWKSTHEGISYLNFSENQYEIGFYTGRESYYLKLDQTGNELQKTKIASPLVDVDKRAKRELLLLMGPLNNIDEPTGEIITKTDETSKLIGPLERPINFEVEDFNGDGVDDILVAEFGKFLGGINIYPQGDYNKKINIHPAPGAVKTILKDVNQDGLMDFYVLVTQADESVYQFINKGDFTFEKKQLVSLPAHYGTTHFELVDMDGDGDDDLICSSGDSGDYGIVLKPFHGVRIFENLGNDQYDEVWFHAQQGAYGTVSADFDQDGDLDIASIGYFASYFKRDRELFIYFENQGDQKGRWQFKPYGFKAKPNDCWILIDTADVDHDGDLDILLGANSKILDPERKAKKLVEWQQSGGMVTVLRNTLVE